MSDFYIMLAAILVVISVLSFTLMMRVNKKHDSHESTADDDYVDDDLTVTLINHKNIISETDFK